MVNTNFNLFNIPGGHNENTSPSFNAGDKTEKENLLNYALREIEIGSADSIELVVRMFSYKRMPIPPKLHKLHELFNQGRLYDKQFGDDLKELQLQTKIEIEEMLN